MAVAFFGKFFGRTVSEAAAYGAGLATGPVLRPVTQAVENEIWQLHPDKPLDAGVAAAVAAERVDDYDRMAHEASMHGYSGQRFADLYGEALNAPGVPMLVELYRRGNIGDADLLHGLRKAKLEDRWEAPIGTLLDGRLSPQEVAAMIQRGILPNEDILPVVPPQSGGVVPAVGEVQLDPLAEAKAGGYNRERLTALARIQGLPPAHGELLQLLNRGDIELADYYRGIAEGNTRNEWADVLRGLGRRILTPTEYVDAHLRGYITATQMYAGTALSGMTKADTDTLFLSHGRPITVHQITTGRARGGVYDGPVADIPEEYLLSLREGSIKPPWYNLAYANRYSYPSAFFFRLLQQQGTLSQADAEQVYIELGWNPKWAKQISTALAGGTSKAGDPHVAKAQTQLWTQTHKSYLSGLAPQADITQALSRLGLDAQAQTDVLATWGEEKALIRKELSAKQLTKAWKEQVTNPATGQPWTQAEVQERLLGLGYDTADAQTLIEEA